MASHTIEVTDLELGQILDAVEMRMRTWEDTERILRTDVHDGPIEECSGPEEAAAMAESYQAILRKLLEQVELGSRS